MSGIIIINLPFLTALDRDIIYAIVVSIGCIRKSTTAMAILFATLIHTHLWPRLEDLGFYGPCYKSSLNFFASIANTVLWKLFSFSGF